MKEKCESCWLDKLIVYGHTLYGYVQWHTNEMHKTAAIK